MRPQSSFVIRFDENGTATMLYDHKELADEFRKSLGESVIKRASHVLPKRVFQNRLLGFLNVRRNLFRFLRKVCGDEGRVAGWTRLWGCPWEVDLSPMDGPLLGPYTSRSEAIAVEKEWLWVNCNI